MLITGVWQRRSSSDLGEIIPTISRNYALNTDSLWLPTLGILHHLAWDGTCFPRQRRRASTPCRPGQDPGTAEKGQSGAAGGGPEDAGRGCQPAADCRRLRVFPQHRPTVVPAGRCDTMIRAATVASSQPHPPRSLAGKPLAGFCATPIRRKPVLWGTVVHVLR